LVLRVLGPPLHDIGDEVLAQVVLAKRVETPSEEPADVRYYAIP
jgi:hypothetical protein